MHTIQFVCLCLKIKISYDYKYYIFSFVPESPRWLLSRDKKREAFAILNKIAETNGNKMVILEDDIKVDKENTSSFLYFIRTMSKSKQLMLRLVVTAFNWYVKLQGFNYKKTSEIRQTEKNEII